ncbi:hypothetical protein Vadar_031615 [Vaccinium darrowii]|uniref:Uncharacterized protein n=1 Tax=Vaccinium darrowii TaxID=229202 RepID=A0ACB7Z8T5_9ERIC|nr:hypothetical protein Vadar_031615 [Vaccinium darrowii]
MGKESGEETGSTDEEMGDGSGSRNGGEGVKHHRTVGDENLVANLTKQAEIEVDKRFLAPTNADEGQRSMGKDFRTVGEIPSKETKENMTDDMASSRNTHRNGPMLVTHDIGPKACRVDLLSNSFTPLDLPFTSSIIRSSEQSNQGEPGLSFQTDGKLSNIHMDLDFEERLKAVKRSALEQKRIDGSKEYESVDYNAPVESASSTVGFGTKKNLKKVSALNPNSNQTGN